MGLRIIQQRSVRGRNYVSCVVLLIIVLQTARGRAFLEYGSELCVAQVLDHSFFHIGETYWHKASHDKSSTASILVVNGKLYSKTDWSWVKKISLVVNYENDGLQKIFHTISSLWDLLIPKWFNTTTISNWARRMVMLRWSLNPRILPWVKKVSCSRPSSK